MKDNLKIGVILFFIIALVIFAGWDNLRPARAGMGMGPGPGLGMGGVALSYTEPYVLPTSYNFGTQTVGATYTTTHDFVYTNPDTQYAYSFGQASLLNGVAYTILSDPCSGYTIAANGGTCVVRVEFGPATTLSYTDILTMPYRSSW